MNSNIVLNYAQLTGRKIVGYCKL